MEHLSQKSLDTPLFTVAAEALKPAQHRFSLCKDVLKCRGEQRITKKKKKKEEH